MWMPKYSKQGYKERNCGQHCVAMITHLPVSFICSEMNKYKGTYTKDVTGMLRWFGVDCGYTEQKGQLPDLAVICVRNHWAVYYKGTVYCSCLGIIPLSKYVGRIKYFIKVEVPNG